MVPFYCIAEMWLFPDASRLQIKNLETACATCTGCCRAAPRGSYHLSCLLAALHCCSFQSSLRQRLCSHGGQQFGISQGTVWSPECTCGWCWFLPLWRKDDSGEFKTGESKSMCRPANVQLQQKVTALITLQCGVPISPGENAFITNPKICVKLER